MTSGGSTSGAASAAKAAWWPAYGAMTVTVMNQQAQALIRSMPSPRRRTGLRGRLPDAGARVMVPAELEALCAQKRQRLAL